MSKSQKEMRLFEAAMAILFLMGGILLTIACVGCTPAQSDWPPAISFDSAGVRGYVVLATPLGESRVDLATGLVDGEAGDITVTSWGVEVDTAVSLNGQTQTMEVTASKGCLSGRLGVMGMLISGRWPLDPECGPPGLGEVVYRPFP